MELTIRKHGREWLFQFATIKKFNLSERARARIVLISSHSVPQNKHGITRVKISTGPGRIRAIKCAINITAAGTK